MHLLCLLQMHPSQELLDQLPRGGADVVVLGVGGLGVQVGDGGGVQGE